MPESAPETMPLHDVVIVGGGLVGASLAIALERAGLDVALVEATPSGALPAVFDERNLSFADASINALNALGVMQKLRRPVGPIRRIHVTRAGDVGRVRLDAADYGRTDFGAVVVARDFGEALEARLQEMPRITRYRPARCVGIDAVAEEGVAAGCRVVHLVQDGQAHRLGARLLVAADGTRSQVRDALEIPVREHDYAQTLFVARVRAEQAPDGTAYERFRDDGPTALLPRGDHHHGAIHAVARADADAVAALDETAFLQRLQHAFGWRVGRLLSCGPRSAYPAIQVVADTCIAPQAVLVGNAAQTLHPNGAQGFNLGLRDALTLAELLEAEGIAAVRGDLLPRYVQRRAEDRSRTLAFSDGLARLTANPTRLAASLRAVGLFAADRWPALQAHLVGGAMGYRGDVPALCRGPAP